MEVKGLINSKFVVSIVISLTLMFAAVSIVSAQSPSESQTFFEKDYGGISIVVNGTKETVPGGQMIVDIWINCTISGIEVDCFNISIYGFKEGREKTIFYIDNVLNDTKISLNWTMTKSYNVSVPVDVWDATYCEFCLKYKVNLDPLYFYIQYEPTFPITIVRNVPFEQFKEDFKGLFTKLMEQFREFKQLNKTYNDLKQNYTSMQNSMNELDSARRVAVILAITTVFFVATTAYLVLRRPKEYW